MVLDFFSGKDKNSVEKKISDALTKDPEAKTEDKTQKNLETTSSIQIGQCVKVRSGYRIYEGLTGTVVAEPRPGRYDVKLDETVALKPKTIRMDPKDFKIIQWSKEYKSVKDRPDVEEDGIRVVDEWRDDDSGAKGADSTKREEARRGSGDHQAPENRVVVRTESEQSDAYYLLGKRVMVMNGPCKSQVGVVRSQEWFPRGQSHGLLPPRPVEAYRQR